MGIDPVASRNSGRTETKWYSMKVDRNYTKSYHAATAMLMILTASARVVLDKAVESMDESNHIVNSPMFKKELSSIAEAYGKTMSDNTVNKAFSELAKEGFLLKTDKRGLYKVNPLFYHKGTMADRIKSITKDLEKPISDVEHVKAIREGYVRKFQPP